MAIEHENPRYSSSSPDPEVGTSATEPTGTQRRKSGRKPIYTTSEERKERNRQAQAAFRERRVAYIKYLETAIKNHKETLDRLQQNHHSVVDECRVLRYNNSLLMEILIEGGIDVQAELRAKIGSPHQAPRGNVFASQPLRLQPIPPSQTSSPNPASPVYVLQGVAYDLPPFQDCLNQPSGIALCGVQADTADSQETRDFAAGPSPYAQTFLQPNVHSLPPQLGQHTQPPPFKRQEEATGTTLAAGDQIFDPYNPVLGTDPFGLSASMHFATPSP